MYKNSFVVFLLFRKYALENLSSRKSISSASNKPLKQSLNEICKQFNLTVTLIQKRNSWTEKSFDIDRNNDLKINFEIKLDFAIIKKMDFKSLRKENRSEMQHSFLSITEAKKLFI